MTTQQKLEKIKAKCEEIIRLGEKRTPGSWTCDDYAPHQIVAKNQACVASALAWEETIAHDALYNATFISTLAGPAEAMARSTIAAIDGLLSLAVIPQVEAPDEMHQAWEQCAREADDVLNFILSAWPDELL